MLVCPVRNQLSGKMGIVLKSKKVSKVIAFLWSMSLKMSFFQVNKTPYGSFFYFSLFSHLVVIEQDGFCFQIFMVCCEAMLDWIM